MEGKIKRIMWAVGLTMLVVIMLVPYAKNGFWFDDTLNSQTWGMVNRFDTTLWSFSVRVIRAWLVDYGRFILCWPAIYGFFYLVRDVLAVRLIDIGLLITHIALTVWLLRRLHMQWRTVGIFLLLLFPLFQIRDTEDPIAAFATFSQMLAIALTVSLLLLQKWRETGAIGWLLVSSLLATISMMCYEINSIYVPIALLAVYVARRKVVCNAIVVLLPFACFVAASLVLKHGATKIYEGSKFGTVAAIPVTYLKQLFAALPGSFYVMIGRNEIPITDLLRSAAGSGLAWAIAILWAALFIAVSRTTLSVRDWPRSAALVVASSLLLVPPALIAMSAKYQVYLSWGAGHIPVYYEYFGLAILGAIAIDYLISKRVSWFVGLVAIAFIVYASLNWEMNMHQSSRLDAEFREPRDSLVAALHNGLLDGVRDEDIVRIENQPIFINGNLIYQTIRKNVSIPNELAIAGWFENAPRSDAHEFRLVRSDSPGHPWALIPVR
ncbi:hypothetical protein [Paraburkholderia guartelaensis]|uniref:hypothetical protein n=1 Tax=Paraburkholderia guartelaensis TaxID=2546446 RepID=UPI002AB7CEB0|nr:hypothetical protein [Paraburkholderia guartelaensis]